MITAMKKPAILWTPLARTTALNLAFVLSTFVFMGCATDRDPQSERLSNERYRVLHPRQYYESASPSERQEMDHQEREKEWIEKHK
jgi:hypothetical protein